MADALVDIDRMIAKLDELSELPERVAPQVARQLERGILANVARGVGPDGKPWAPTADGHKPLQGTSSGLTVQADGTRIVAHLEGVHARHHLGRVRGGIARPILPVTDALPAPLERIVAGVINDEIARTL